MATTKYNTEFPIFEKCDVNGPNAHEVYKYLRRNSNLYDSQKEISGEIPWNFAKFLINSKGEVHGYYSSRTEPNAILPDIKQLLLS